MKKFLSLILSAAIILLALPYLSSGTSVFMAKWAYDWGLPVPVVKLILISVAAILLLILLRFVKKVVVILAIALLVMIGLNALGLYNMRTDPKDIVAQISNTASENSETIVTASKGLFYQASVYVTEVNPVKALTDFVAGEDSYWYMVGKDEEVDFSQEIFQGYEIEETKEVNAFKAYHLVKK